MTTGPFDFSIQSIVPRTPFPPRSRCRNNPAKFDGSELQKSGPSLLRTAANSEIRSLQSVGCGLEKGHKLRNNPTFISQNLFLDSLRIADNTARIGYTPTKSGLSHILGEPLVPRPSVPTTSQDVQFTRGLPRIETAGLHRELSPLIFRVRTGLSRLTGSAIVRRGSHSHSSVEFLERFDEL